MKTIFLTLGIVGLLTAFRFMPASEKSITPTVSKISSVAQGLNILNLSAAAASMAIYDSLDLGKLGLSKEALTYACQGQQYLAKKGMLLHPDILTVCDFSQASNRKRMYIIDTRHVRLLMNTYVAHGRNSGSTFAERFSNKLQSLQSSLGFYITRSTYFGKHGLSLKLSGKDKGFNDNAESRAVVVHGATYIGGAFMGRSWGCPAVPQQEASTIINIIKDGTCLFIYHPSTKYFLLSKILNG